jgi:hypothetical protein
LAFQSWFLLIEHERCGKVRTLNQLKPPPRKGRRQQSGAADHAEIAARQRPGLT